MKSIITPNTSLADFTNPQIAKSYESIETYAMDIITVYIRTGIGLQNNRNQHIKQFVYDYTYNDWTKIIDDALNSFLRLGYNSMLTNPEDAKDVLKYWNKKTEAEDYFGDIPLLIYAAQKQDDNLNFNMAFPTNVMKVVLKEIFNLIMSHLSINKTLHNLPETHAYSYKNYETILKVINTTKNEKDFLGEDISSATFE